MTKVTERTRLNTQQRMMVLAMLSRGDTQRQVIDQVDSRFGLSISNATVSVIKNKHLDVLETMKTEIIKAETEDAKELLLETRRQLSTKLRKSRNDELKLEEIHKEYREGKIDKKQYERNRSGYLTLGVRDLGDLSKKLHDQSVKSTDSDAPGNNPGNMKMIDDITRAIKDGNTIELQRIIFNASTVDT